ncbi:CopD family protein [Nitrosomonas mobilis]|uniref:Cytochrome c, class IC:Cytochrome c, class I n=1 Tax=Nitrosomonas mobilis TaxID=51642 RepID=A0A1G5SIG6_9PROT|nr:CopD family protein [Nitrosomonas mobilis]SCZ87003.1 Cytochrome c, class IC:Cytochrome c, class I [Nitrosomonas mobilis]
MLDFFAATARWTQLVANLVLLGSCFFLAYAGRSAALYESPWVRRLERVFPWLAGLILAGLVGILAITTAEATGVDANVLSPSAWLGVIVQTKMGHMWVARAVFASILFALIVFLLQKNPRKCWHYYSCAVAAAFPLIAGALVSHSAAEEDYFTYVSLYAIHILLAGIWLGALPAFLLIIFDKRSIDSQNDILGLNISSLRRFSGLALPVMLAVVLTGIIIADRMIEEDYHALVSSAYGWLLNTKIALLVIILMIAYQARSRWLPLFEKLVKVDMPHNAESTSGLNHFQRLFSDNAQNKKPDNGSSDAAVGVAKLQKWIRIEFILALFLVLFATMLSNTVPAKHEMVEYWPYPFRFSIDATWENPVVQSYFWSGMAVLAIGIASIWLGIKNNWQVRKRYAVSATLIITALLIILPQFAVKAYPETYQSTPVPFDTISISNGSTFFAENCTSCHGPQGAGNGVLAKTFSPPPADLLTEAHTARHTAGDFFHWLTYGIAETGMPSFAANLSEEDRWDTVNYLHAMSRGYQARLLNSSIVPGRPSIGPPMFQFTTVDGKTGILKDYRQRSNVMLVLFSWPDSSVRLKELAEMTDRLRMLNTEILAIPMDEFSKSILEDVAAELPFPVVLDGWYEIKNSYILFRRTLTHPDIMGEGVIPDHMEFLIDRFGYLRARWIPSIDSAGWDDSNLLAKELARLNQEGEILPPPSDHVH